MAKVLTVSRIYPAYHPKKGLPTYFVEKILLSLLSIGEISISRTAEIGRSIDDCLLKDIYDIRKCDLVLKHHTIRKGKRFKTGDIASLRIWGTDVNPKSGRSGPYHSKQIIIDPDVKVTCFDFEIEVQKMKNINKGDVYVFVKINGKHVWCNAERPYNNSFELLAKNDGLMLEDFKSWFKYPKPFSGQIICWNESVNY